jgi:hypothetical protein
MPGQTYILRRRSQWKESLEFLRFTDDQRPQLEKEKKGTRACSCVCSQAVKACPCDLSIGNPKWRAQVETQKAAWQVITFAQHSSTDAPGDEWNSNRLSTQ